MLVSLRLVSVELAANSLPLRFGSGLFAVVRLVQQRAYLRQPVFLVQQFFLLWLTFHLEPIFLPLVACPPIRSRPLRPGQPQAEGALSTRRLPVHRFASFGQCANHPHSRPFGQETVHK